MFDQIRNFESKKDDNFWALHLAANIVWEVPVPFHDCHNDRIFHSFLIVIPCLPQNKVSVNKKKNS
jgi:hypothetical protein